MEELKEWITNSIKTTMTTTVTGVLDPLRLSEDLRKSLSLLQK